MERYVDATLCYSILDIIHDTWDSYSERGVSRPMIDFEFCLDMGDPIPMCSRQPVYGFHESKIIAKQITDLEVSGLITNCEGAWELFLLLIATPH